MKNDSEHLAHRAKELLRIKAEEAVLELFRYIGEDLHREGLRETPARVVKALQEMTSGMQENPKEILGTVFGEKCDEMVVVQGIEFTSLCEHHMLPFTGTCDVGYIPNGRVVGLSKIPRLVQCFAKRLQVQERMTRSIASAMEEYLNPLGVGVVVRGRHSCCEARGVRSKNVMVTSDLRGVMRDKPEARAEFLALTRAS